MATINEIQDEIIEEFAGFDDWMDKYQLLIDLGNEQEPLDEQYKTESNLIDGCQSRVWLQADYVGMRNERNEGNERNGNEEMRNEPRGEVPIIINSGYRSAAVNRAVGGATGSNHLTGCAVDIRCKGIEQAIRYAFILLDISEERGEPFDELLIEKSAKSVWVHFAVKPCENRRRVDFLNKK